MAKKDEAIRILDRAKFFRKKKRLKAVPVVKSTGFCILQDGNYFEKLQEVVPDLQFTGITNDENLLLKTETTSHKELHVL